MIGLSQKDLQTSCSSLKEGVDLLNNSVDKLNLEQKAVLVEAQDGETSQMLSGAETSIFTQALELPYVMRKLRINSNKDFESAKERFKDARMKAIEAFSNEMLSIKNRIFATKLRMASEIVENLEDPETAITGCLSFLKELHSLPDVREMFTVYLNGGFKSVYNKAERVENVKSVMLINYVLHQFSFIFGNKCFGVLSWPAKIELENRSFNPIFSWEEISKRNSWYEELIQSLNKMTIDEVIDPHKTAVNGNGEILVITLDDRIKVISRTGETKVIEFPSTSEKNVIYHTIEGLAVDKNNNVYAVRKLEKRTNNGDVNNYVLYVLDQNYNDKCDCTLDFLEIQDSNVGITINKHEDIILIRDHDPHVYVCDNDGRMKHKFERDSTDLGDLGLSKKNEIIIPSNDRKSVYLYTEEEDLKSTIELPEGHVPCGVVFHHLMDKIIVLCVSSPGLLLEDDLCFLHFYSQTCELETSTFLCEVSEDEQSPHITSHPGGPTAVVMGKSITFI